MKICHLVPNYYPLRPMPIFCTRVLAEMGHEVDVIALQREGEPLLEYSHGVRILRVPEKKNELFLLTTAPSYLLGIQRYLKQYDFDLIHVTSFRGCSLLPVLNRKKGIRWVLDIRTGNIAANILQVKIANLITKIESRAYKEITINPLIAGKVLNADTPYTVVPIGADFNKFQPGRDPLFRQSLGIQDDDLAIIFSSSLAPQRHPEVALEAFRLALLKVPHLKLLVVGDGGSRKSLEAITVEKGIADRVIFTGLVPFDDMPNYITAADIGLGYIPITPQYDLQPPLKTVEYLASGLPVVATKTQGNLLFMQQDVNGLLCDDNPETIADKIIFMALESARREEMAGLARISVEHHDWNRIVKDMLLPVYQRVLEDPSFRTISPIES